MSSQRILPKDIQDMVLRYKYSRNNEIFEYLYGKYISPAENDEQDAQRYARNLNRIIQKYIPNVVLGTVDIGDDMAAYRLIKVLPDGQEIEITPQQVGIVYDEMLV